MRDRWLNLCQRIGIAQAETWWQQLSAAYCEPVRAYHNLVHIKACLDLIDQHEQIFDNPDIARAAIWFHDAVYQPLAKDNESASASLARACVAESSLADRAELIAQIILATRHTGEPLSGDTAAVADIDMSILASDSLAYDRYAAAIRQEYPSVTDAQFAAGRSNFIRGLLSRAKIYHLPYFAARWEQLARTNLQQELDQLAPPA